MRQKKMKLEGTVLSLKFLKCLNNFLKNKKMLNSLNLNKVNLMICMLITKLSQKETKKIRRQLKCMMRKIETIALFNQIQRGKKDQGF